MALSARRLLEYVAAILLGNAIYLLSLRHHLPKALQHEIFEIDWGLAVDFLVCVGVYGLIQWAKRVR